MEWQNPIVSWWIWHRYPSHPSSDNDHVNFRDMLISMEVCYSIFNIQTYHVGMNYGKLESRMAWKYCDIVMKMTITDTKAEEMSVLGIHWWSPSPLLWFLVIYFFSQGPLSCGLGNSRVTHHPEAISLTFTKKMQNTVFDILFSKSLASLYLFSKVCSIYESNFITDRYCKR